MQMLRLSLLISFGIVFTSGVLGQECGSYDLPEFSKLMEEGCDENEQKFECIVGYKMIVSTTCGLGKWNETVQCVKEEEEVEEEEDFCEPNPCLNGGTCTNGQNNYTCDCAGGWEGDTCEKEDYCAPRLCLNGGTCRNGQNEYTCDCASGWEGDTCEKEDYCESHACLNGGTCENGENDYTCECAGKFFGDKCENCLNYNRISGFSIDGTVYRKEPSLSTVECQPKCGSDSKCITYSQDSEFCYMYNLPLSELTQVKNNAEIGEKNC